MPQCQVCGIELKLIPAGTSKKTGKPYNAFYSCPNRCQQPKPQNAPPYQEPRYVPNYAPAPPNNAPRGNFSPTTPLKSPDWDKISLGKVRHGVALEAIKLGMPLNSETANWIIKWTNFIMTSKLDEIINVENVPF